MMTIKIVTSQKNTLLKSAQANAEAIFLRD
jgi:hypothetical protein